MKRDSFRRCNRLLMGLFGLCLASGLCGCRQAALSPAAEANPLRDLTGRVEIDGSSTVFPITEAVAKSFQDAFPDVNVTVGVSGTGGGFKRFTVGETDVSNASRAIKQEEFAVCVEKGVPFVELPIAYDGLTVVVNPKNDWVDQLTIEDLQRIFLETEAVKSWADLDENWPDRPIKVYSPGTDSGTFDYFKEVMRGDMRKDMSTSEDDNVLVTGVAGELGAIGFFGVAYYEENKDKLRPVPIVNPQTGQAVSPELEAIEDGTYAPLSRPLFIYVRETSLRRPECRIFIEFYLENVKTLAGKVGYVRLPDDLYDRARQQFESRNTGTYFLTDAGKPREGSLTEIYIADNLRSVE